MSGSLSARLRKLPGELLLALVNGTAILVIVAAVLVLVASTKLMHLSETIAASATDAILSRAGAKPVEVIQKIDGISDDVNALRVALKRARDDGAPRIGDKIDRLSETLSALDANIEKLRDARTLFADELVTKAAVSVGQVIQNLRACPSGTRQGSVEGS
jgi:uncharacterized phage infection (PIP) family protein YhgE